MDKIGKTISRKVGHYFDTIYYTINCGSRKRTLHKGVWIKTSPPSYHIKGGRIGYKRVKSVQLAIIAMFALQGQAAQYDPSFKFKHPLNGRHLIHKKIEHLDKAVQKKKSKRIYNDWYDKVITAFHVTNDHKEEPVAFSVKRRKATPEVCQFNTDAYTIGIDSNASQCISPFIQDFDKKSLKPISTSR